MSKRLLFPAVAFLLTAAALLPSALSLPQHGDERLYIWKAAYYGNRLVRLDFSPGADPYLDPGWDPQAFWAVEQPTGSHVIYFLALSLTASPTATLPYSYTDPDLQGPETAIPPSTLIVTRVAAVLCAAVGAALLTARFGWPALPALALFLAIPHVRDDLARAWAEGPLLLGFGLCAIAYGSRWFAPMCGVAAAFKLTALVTWPLAFWRGWGSSRYAHVLGIVIAWLAWSVASPTSWVGGGPLYLANLLVHRIVIYAGQSAAYGGPLGLFFPTRYLWPVELAALLAIAVLAVRFWQRRHPPAPADAAG